MPRARCIFAAQRLADPQALPSLLRRAAPPRLLTRRAAAGVALLVALALVASSTLVACGGGAGAHTKRQPGPPGQIEALREAQERAQQKIEAEGSTHAREAQRAQEAARREAEGEAADRTGSAP